MRVKICGITKPQQGREIATLGATALGFICVPTSPRFITSQQIQAVVEQLPEGVARIGVFVNTGWQAICQTVAVAHLTGVQLHGDETPEYCDRLRQLLPTVEIIKALRVRNVQTLVQAEAYTGRVDTLLLDAYHPQHFGGTGKTLDWDSLRQYQPNCPWLLAGGLTPDNIIDALSQVNPSGIDLSSGLERTPGDKDLTKVSRLFEQLRRMGRG